MKTSRLGIWFIARREGLVLTAYRDGAHYSIGFGTNSPSYKEGDTVTVPLAFKLLTEGIRDRERLLNVRLKVPVKQHQYDALMSLLYQAGRDDLEAVLEYVNAGDIEGASEEFLEHGVNAKGEEMPGLVKRRQFEKDMFDGKGYGELNPIPYWSGNPRKTKMKQYYIQPQDLPDE